MMVVVVNEVLHGGWLEFLTRVKYDKEKQFDMAEEKKKNVIGNASRMVEEGKRREEAGKQRELQREQQRKQQLEEVNEEEEEIVEEDSEQQLHAEQEQEDQEQEEAKEDNEELIESTVWDTSTNNTAGIEGRSLEEMRGDGFVPLHTAVKAQVRYF
jgi:hypothetical protein